MSKINWVGVLGSSALVGVSTLTAGCWNGSGIKNGPDQATSNITAGQTFVTSLGSISPANFADFTSGFSNEVDAASLLAPKSLPASLGLALADAGSFFESQNGATGSTTFGTLTVTITNPSGTQPVVAVGGTLGSETLNLTIDAGGGANSFAGTFVAGSTISTSSGPGETLTFNNASVAISTSNNQPIAAGGANVATIGIGGDISLAQLSGATAVSFATLPAGNSSNYWLTLCKNGTFCLSPYDLSGTFTQGTDQVTGHLEGGLASPAAFDPTVAAGVGNVPVGQFQLLIGGVTIPGVPANTNVAISEELSGYYSDGVTQSPVGEFQVRVEESGSELFQIQIDTSAPASGPVKYTANLTNTSGALMIVNPFTGETAGQVGQVSDNGTVMGTLTPASPGALTLTYSDSTTATLFDVTAVEGTVASLFN